MKILTKTTFQASAFKFTIYYLKFPTPRCVYKWTVVVF